MTKNLSTKTTATAILLTLSIGMVIGNLIPVLNVALLPIFALGLYMIREDYGFNEKLKIMIWLVTILLGFFIAIYRPDNFNYPLLWETKNLYDGGNPFALHANTSKAIGGYLVLVWLLLHVNGRYQLRPLSTSIASGLIAVISILLIANTVFGIPWKFKIPSGLPHFVLINLAITVVAEEAFFRLLIQQKIFSLFKSRGIGFISSIGLTSILFALAHSTTIGMVFWLFLIAGLIYAAVYAFTNRFSVAIGVHFGVNLLHFLLLEYPISY